MQLDGAGLGALHEALLSAYSLAMLRRMLRFELGWELERISLGEDLDTVVEALLDEAERQGALQALVAAAHKRNPGNLPLRAFVEAHCPEALLPLEGRQARFSGPVRGGLLALVDLMREPDVQAAVATFREAFGAASEGIERLADYKTLHDLLHRLYYVCYNRLVLETSAYPADGASRSAVMQCQGELERIIYDLEEEAGTSSVPVRHLDWRADLERANGLLLQAMGDRTRGPLEQAIAGLKRVIDRRPSSINSRLNEAASHLRLASLADGMASISERMAGPVASGLPADATRVAEFEAGLDALVVLKESLETLVSDHDEWQRVDEELLEMEGRLPLGVTFSAQDRAALGASLAHVAGLIEPLCGRRRRDYASRLATDRASLAAAIAREDLSEIGLYFGEYRREAGLCFHEVDQELKRLCDDVRKIGEPLDLLMRLMQ